MTPSPQESNELSQSNLNQPGFNDTTAALSCELAIKANKVLKEHVRVLTMKIAMLEKTDQTQESEGTLATLRTSEQKSKKEAKALRIKLKLAELKLKSQ